MQGIFSFGTKEKMPIKGLGKRTFPQKVFFSSSIIFPLLESELKIKRFSYSQKDFFLHFQVFVDFAELIACLCWFFCCILQGKNNRQSDTYSLSNIAFLGNLYSCQHSKFYTFVLIDHSLVKKYRLPMAMLHFLYNQIHHLISVNLVNWY